MDGLFYPLRVSLWVLMQSIKCWKLFQRRQTANNYRCCWKYLYAITRVWARPRHCANPALQLELSLSKTAKGTICPLQNLGKKLERKHTRRDLFQYRNCKLKQNVESIFYRTLKVHSKVTFQSHSTAIFVWNLRQGFWFFARSRSREIYKNTKNTAKFGRNLIKYMSVQHIWNLFQL